MTIYNLINWLQEAEDNNTWLVSTQSVKRHLEKIKETEKLNIPTNIISLDFAEWININGIRNDEHVWTYKGDNFTKKRSTQEMFDEWQKVTNNKL